VDFKVRLPAISGLTAPEIYLRENGIVSLVYPASTDFPAAHGTNVGVILTEFKGDTTEAIDKLLHSGTAVEVVTVNGQIGLWLTGEDHFVFFVNPDNGFVEVPGHIAGNTLLWEQDGITFRIEANVVKAGALHLAESLR
jgi:hypothetical protein